MTSVSDALVVVKDLTTLPLLLVLNSTVTDATHSGGTVVLQVTLAPGVEPSTLLLLTVTVGSENSAAIYECMCGCECGCHKYYTGFKML